MERPEIAESINNIQANDSTVSICQRCSKFEHDTFFLDIYDRHVLQDGPLEVRRTWDTGRSLRDTSKAFWLGTVAQLKSRVVDSQCTMCEFVLDSAGVFWQKKGQLIETFVDVKTLPDDIEVCFFRWRSVGCDQNTVSPEAYEDYLAGRDSNADVLIGAASTHIVDSTSEWELEEAFGRVRYTQDEHWASEICCEKDEEELEVNYNLGGPKFDPRWAMEVLKECQKDHRYCKHPSKVFGSEQTREHLAKSIRLIEVPQRRVIQHSDCTKPVDLVNYATLSYVWGPPSSQTYCLTSASLFDKIGDAVYGHVLPESLPRTIEDAMHISLSLGIRYLWVDSLCIMQDDDEDKRAQIQQMGMIYANCIVCITDAAGSSANAGLSGVSIPRSRTLAVINSTTTLSRHVFAIRKMSRGSPWLQRGWTYQERIMAPRSLIFYEPEAVFVCGADNAIAEVSVGVSGDLSNFDDAPMYGIPSLNTAKDIEEYSDVGTDSYSPRSYYEVLAMFAQAARTFSDRRLTNERDLLNAFSSIASAFSKGLACDFSFGVPVRALHRHLLWKPDNGKKRSSDLNVDLPTAEGHLTYLNTQVESSNVSDVAIQHKPMKRASIPSWAWTNWKGKISFPAAQDTTVAGTQIIMLDIGLNHLHPGLQIALDGHGLAIKQSSHMALTKIAWMTIDIVETPKYPFPIGQIRDPSTDSHDFIIPAKWPGNSPSDRPVVHIKRECSIEDETLKAGTTMRAAFIQIGALEQYSRSGKNDARIRCGYEDECYLLLVHAEHFPFDQLSKQSAAYEHLRTVMSHPHRFVDETANYADFLGNRMVLPRGRQHRHPDLVVGNFAKVRDYQEDSVFVTRRMGIGHVPESSWRAAKPRDVMVFLT